MKRFSLVAAIMLAAALLMLSLSGCGIVKVIPVGTEGDYTGVVEFDASAEAADDWELIATELTGTAQPLADTLASAANGTAFSGTTVRDCQTGKAYEDFTNQTEWSQYAKTVNDEVLTNVIEPLGDLNALVGKTVEIVGCFTPEATTITVTPVAITVQ